MFPKVSIVQIQHLITNWYPTSVSLQGWRGMTQGQLILLQPSITQVLSSIITHIMIYPNHDDFAGPGPEAGDPRAHQGPGQWGYPGGGHGGQVPGQGSPSDRYSYYDNRWLQHLVRSDHVAWPYNKLFVAIRRDVMDQSKTKLPSFQSTAQNLGHKTILLNIENVGIVTV